ncbi:MAG: PA14 domain-containing protein [Bacteroidota bacterium]
MKGVHTTSLYKALRSLAPGIMFVAMLVTSGMPGAYARGAAGVESAPVLQSGAPADFGKLSPGNGTGSHPVSLTLEWNASPDATSYEYCTPAKNSNNCNVWNSVGTATSVSISGLSGSTTYYWQVRANNATGTTYADAGILWTFTTGALPANFTKSSPADLAAGLSLTPTLAWGTSTGATSYEYCLDPSTTNCEPADPGWVNVGSATNVIISPPLSEYTTYYWHVRAVNDIGVWYSGNNNNASSFRSFQTGGHPLGFNKTNPADSATGVPVSAALQWQTSGNAASYGYCIGISTSACDANWQSAGANTSVSPALNPDTTYFWHASAANSFGTTYSDGSASSFRSFTTAAAPADFDKTGPTDGATGIPANPTLQWGTSPDATSYAYCFGTSASVCDPTTGTWTSAGTATSIPLSGLNPATVYFWQVRAANASGTTYAGPLPAGPWSFTTGNLPGAFGKGNPANLADNQPLSLTLSWSTSTDVGHYEYCYGISTTACNAAWTSVGTSLSTPISGLSLNTLYYWHVRAVNSFGVTYSGGLPTSFRTFTTGDVPGTFNKTAPADGAAGVSLTPLLSWEASSNADYYEYCIDKTNDSGCTTGWKNAGNATSVTVSPALTQNTIYYWQVRAVNTFGTTYSGTGPGAYRTFTTGTVPGTFGKSNPPNGTTGRSLTPTLQWSASTGVSYYEYCIGTSAAVCDPTTGTWTNAGNVTSVTINNPALLQYTPYYWHVRAVNDFGTTYSDGAGSAYWSFTTGGTPWAFNKTGPANGATGQLLTASLQWQASQYAGSYEYCLDPEPTNNNICDTSWIPAGNVLSVSPGLTAATTYSWQVRARNSFGTTDAGPLPAAFWTFTTGALPGAFNKGSPADAATGVVLNPSLTWQASANVTYYEYCLDQTAANTCSTSWVNVGNVTSVTISPLLSANATYYWHVRAVNGIGMTYSGTTNSPGAYRSFTTGNPFNKLSPANLVTGVKLNPDLQWDATTVSADSYEYCIDTTNDNTCTNWINVGDVSHFTLTSPLSEYTWYYWHARARSGPATIYYTNGSATAFGSFQTGGKPRPFNKTSPTSSMTVARPVKPTLKWAASTNATSYAYCIDTANDGICNRTWVNVGNVTSITVTGLKPSTTYYWQVRAGNTFGSTYANGVPNSYWTLRTAGVCPSITGWKGEYWANGSLTGPALICRNDPPISPPQPLSFNWAYGSPDPKIPSENFTARWTRRIKFPTAGRYIFYVDHDDGARLYIDNAPKASWWSSCCTTHHVAVTLTAGVHTIRLEYNEKTGAAHIKLWWQQVTQQLPSIGAQDGWVLEAGEISNAGAALSATGTTLALGDDALDRQYRSIVSFNTATLPDNAVITGVVLKVKYAGVVGTSPFSTHGTLLADIRKGPFSGSAVLQSEDWQAPSSLDAVIAFPGTASSGWYSKSMSSGAFSYINKTGLTQFRLRFQRDDDDDGIADYVKFYSGNYATLASRPQLIISYWVP